MKPLAWLRYINSLISSRVFVSVSSLASGNIISSILAFVGGIVQAQYISPNDLGFIRKFSVISGYVVFFQLGLVDILQRDYPYLMGRGEEDKAKHIVSVCQYWSIAISVSFGALFAVMATVLLAAGKWRTACGWGIQSVSISTMLYTSFLSATYRNGHDFKRLATSNVKGQLANTLILPFFRYASFGALVLRSFVGSVYSAIYLHRHRPVRVASTFNWPIWRNLVKRGLPLYGVNYLSQALWISIVMLLVLRYGGDKFLGLYVFACVLIEALRTLPLALIQVYIPRLGYLYGKTGRVTDCLQDSMRPMLICLLSSIVLLFLGLAFAPFVIRALAPKYLDSLPIINILLLLLIVTSIQVPLFALSAMMDMKALYLSTLIGYSVLLSVGYLLLHFGFGAQSFVWATVAGQLANTIARWVFVLLHCNRERHLIFSNSDK